ncbi:MAG: Eco57I restriction-modification methylase domain-containing protein [Anaerolineales bacterium]|nr:Eco57I restriction-modification methylase domain-containing protein [Anaerolineales bacterium]
MDWDFSQATKDGGFDVIIGNPPYIRFENLPESEREDYANSGFFKTAYQKFDIYVLFLERAIS